MDPDQTAARSSLIRVHTVCLYAKIGLKSLQEYSADDINRRNFQNAGFLGILRVKMFLLSFSAKTENSHKMLSYFSLKSEIKVLSAAILIKD